MGEPSELLPLCYHIVTTSETEEGASVMAWNGKGTRDKFSDFPELHVQREAGKRDRLYIVWPAEISGTGKRRKEYFGPADDPASRARYLDARERWRNQRNQAAEQVTEPEPVEGEEFYAGPVVADLVDRYLIHTREKYQRRGKPTGHHQTIWIALKPFLLEYGDVETARIGLDELEEYQMKLDRSGRLCRQQVNARIRMICACFTWGARHKDPDTGERLVPPATAAELRMIENLRRGYCRAVDHPRRLAAPIDDIKKAIKQMTGPVRAMAEVQLLTGARPGEIRLMRAREITRAARNLWEYRPETYKTDRFDGGEGGKVIFLGPKAIKAIRPYLDAAEKNAASGGEGYLFRPVDAAAVRREESAGKKKTPSRAVRDALRAASPRRKYGEVYNADNYREAIHRACERAGVPPFTPYQIRKARATEIDRKQGAEAAAALLGHRNVKTTVDHYIDPRTEQARELAKKIG